MAAAALSLLLLATVGTLAWAHRQANKKQALLEAASLAECAADWTTVESALRRYACLQGDDTDTCLRIGLAIEHGAVNDTDRQRALPFYVRALSLTRRSNEARLRLADLLVNENPPEAIRYANMVLQRQPTSGDAWRIKAIGLARMNSPNETVKDRLHEAHLALDTALQHQPGNLRLATEAAEFYVRCAAPLAVSLGMSADDLQQVAMAALDMAIAHGDDEAEARLTRLLFRRKCGLGGQDDDIACEDLRRLVELRPSSNVVRLLAAGSQARSVLPDGSRRGSLLNGNPNTLSEAKSHLLAAMQNRADDPVPYWSLAQLHWWCGEREAASAVLQQGQQATEGKNAILSLRLAETQLTLGQWSEAENTLRQLDEIVGVASGQKPTVAQVSAVLDSTATDASAEYVTLRPIVDLLRAQWWLSADNPAADPKQALPLLEHHAKTSPRPGLRSLAIYLQGLAFASLDRWGEAADTFLRATQIADSSVLPRLAAAHSLYQLGRYREASSQYRFALVQLERHKQEPLNVTQVWIEAARCALAEQSQRPGWKRDWRSFQEALARVRQRLPESPIPLFLELEAARLHNDPAVRLEAETRLSQAEQTHADSPEFWHLLATDRLRAGNLTAVEKAIETWEHMTDKTAHAFRAELARALGNMDGADRSYQAASAGLGKYQQREYLSRRVATALEYGRVGHARSLLENRLTDHPTDGRTLFHLAQVAWTEGDPSALRQVAATLRRIEGDATRRWRIVQTQALLLSTSQTTDDVTRQELELTCSELVTRFPEDRQVRVLQALVAESMGQSRNAVKALRQAIALGEQDRGVLLRLASLLHDQGQSRKALELCLTVPSSAADCRAATLAARILTTATVDPLEKEQAETRFREILSGPPRHDLPLLLMNLAVLREYQSRPEEAVALSRQALQMRPQAVELKNNLAWFLSAYQDQHAAALELIDEAIQAAGPLPALHDTRGFVLLAAGRTEEAITELETCVRGDAVPAARLLHLAEAYRKAGRIEEARRLVDRAESRGLSKLPPRDRRTYLALKAQS